MAKEITYKGQTVSEDLLKQKADSLGITIDQYLEDYKDDFVVTEEIQEDNTVVTDEIQTPVTEGKTNGAVAKGATATPVTGQAPESTELESDDILSGLEEIKDVREIDKRIKLIAGDDMQVDPLDSTKRITQYKELINKRNNIIGDTYKLGQTQQYQQLDFDPMSPAKIPLEKEGAPEGGVKLAYVPFTVDGEVVGTTMEPVGLQDVVVTAEQYKERENQIQSEAYKNFLEQSGLSTEPLSREEFEAERLKLGTITDASEPEYRGLDPIQAFENIGTMLSSLQQTAQEKENYRLQYENYLKKLGNLDPDVKRKLPGFFESTLGSTANMFLQVGGVDDRALYNLSFIMSTVPDDVYANVFGKDLGADLKKEAIKGFSNINEKINSLNSLTSDTVGITDVGEAEGVLGKTGALVGGAYNAITSFAASYVTNVATAGVGLASDMIANSVKDFNDKKAQSLGLTTEELITSNQSEILTPGFLGMLGYSLERFGMEKVGNFITTGLSQGRAKALVNLAFAAGGEGTTEYLQGLVETFNSSLGEGLSTEDAVDKVKEQLTSKESLERFLQGAVGGSGIALGGQGLKAVSALRSPAENKKLTKIINQLSELENSKFRKNLTADQIGEINTAQEELRFNLKNIVDNNNELISTLTKQQIETLNSNADFLTTSASKINEIQNSEAYTEQDKEVLINAVNQQRELASQNIFNIRNEAEKLQSQIEKVKGLTGLVKGLNIEEADTAADAEKFAEDNNLDIKSSTSQGYILQNPETGEQTIVINKETALNEQAVNIAGHEFLHAILFKTIKDSPQTAINLGNALLSEINKIDVNQIKDSNFKKRMEQYNDQSREVKMEEALTLFSDALATGDISFKENSFTKLGDRVRRVAQKFGLNIKFNTGRDVYNFIKDYNRSVEKGELSIAQVRAAAGGVEGELITPVTEQRANEQIIKESKKTPKGQEFISLVDEGILTNESLVDVVKSPSSTQEDKFGAIEAVVEKNWPVISKAVKFNPTGSIPMDAVKEAVTEQIQGIFPGRGTALFDTYNPETSQVNTFIGSTLGPRQAEILERAQTIGGRTQAADITEARGIAVEETKTQEPTTTRSQIDVRKFGPAKDKVSEISKIVKVKEGKAPSYKDLTNEFLDEVSMEVFNVPGKKMAGRATLTDAEAKSLQRLFVSPDNVRKLIKTMPPYNVATSETTIGPQAEIIDVSRDIKGKSIGLSNKFIEKYYQPVTRAIPGISNPKGRSLGTTSQTQVYELKPEYTGRITNEIVEQIQNDVGVTERGIPNEKISSENRSKYGTTLTGFAKTYIANAINVSARAKQTSKQEQADTGAGKARIMFAKSGIASDMNNTVEKAGGKVLGNTIEDNQTFKTFLVDELTKFLGSETNRIIKPSDVAGAGNSAIGSRKTSGAKGRGFRFIGDINKTQRFIEETEAAIAAGEVMDLQVLRNEIKDKASLLSEDQIEDVIAATSSQTRASMARNETNKDKIKRGKRLILDALFRAVQADINNLGPIRELLYNANANSSFGRKFATVTSIESNLKPKQKTWEEHVFQFGNWANRTLQAYGTKNPDTVNGWLKWSEDNYYQEVTGRDTQGIVDGAYPGWKAKFEEHPYLKEKLDEAFETGDFSQVPPSDIRKYNEFFTLDPNARSRNGITDAERYNVAVDKKFQSNPNVVAEQGKLIYQQFIGEINAKQAENQIKKYVELADDKLKASIGNNNENNTIKFSKEVPNQEVLDNLGNADKAMANARNPEAPVKKIRVFDFDDTLARSNSNVLYEMPDGTTGKLNATQFAARAGELEAQGAEFDFSEFSKVIDGKRGPVFKAIENIIAKRGAEDVFILTARPADAAGPIKEFMDALGVNLPIENIVGLGDGKAEAKARWMTGKAAEGYNDFFFVDDAYKNVKAVQDALDVFDVKSKTQQAKIKFSKESDLDKGFNDILENKTGIASEKEYGRVKAEVAGAGKGRLNFFIPPSAEDFVGLLYATLGKGKLGDQQMAWYKTHLLNPYARAMNELSSARISMMNDYKLLKKQLGIVPKNLRKKVPGEPFTREQAVRVYIWDKQGMSIPGISKKDQAELSKYISDNAELQVFADQLIAIQKGDQYAAPKEGWPAGTITTDMLEGLNTTKRAKYLEQWQQNADVIFSEKNLNKLEAAYGKPYRKAMENMLQRMKSGRNRNFQGDTLTGRVTDWLTGSIGTIMFFNTRSAILQTISSINFVNFTDNNILAAGKAFANQKQYWSDFMTLINSDFLKERRGGLRINVNEADIADMAKRGGARGVINKLLEFGFTPTQIADSFAIASGGATFYRNRIKSLKKQGMTDAEAEAQAFVDFRETAEESQQSSRPDRISMQQAGQLGRLVLAFANTPAQYARLIKKAASDLKNGRGDAKTNISKIIYYGVAQNLLFNALQQALFAFAFDDDEEDTDEQKKKYVSIANGMMDSLLRGMGLGGAIVSVGKNAIIRIINEMEKKNPKLEKVGYEITKISPPISAKLSRINQAARSYQWDKDEMKEKGWSLDNPAYLAGANVIAALTNVPLDRAIKKTNNVVTATSQDLETWERLTLLGGWQDWEIGVDEEKPTNKPQPRKTKSTITKKRKPSKR